MNWYLQAIKKYIVFEGRARRAEFWWFMLINSIISSIIQMFDYRIIRETELAQIQIGVIGMIYGFFIFLPQLAVTVRRLHDINKSGWFCLLFFVPCVGPIILLIMMILKGTDGANAFGEDPLAVESASE